MAPERGRTATTRANRVGTSVIPPLPLSPSPVPVAKTVSIAVPTDKNSSSSSLSHSFKAGSGSSGPSSLSLSTDKGLHISPVSSGPSKASPRKLVGKVNSSSELKGSTSVTMTSTTVTTSVSKMGIMQRLMGKRKMSSATLMEGGASPVKSDTPVLWNSVKLVVVGQENVGKTHLCRQMENSKYELNMSTDGIDIGTWNTGKGKNLINFTTFDFGGQEIFYPTHQFFLTSRCVYIIAFRVDKPDFMERVMYWVRTIDASIPYAAAPPIILVGTHRDHPSVSDASLAAIKSQLDSVSKRFKLIREILFVSCTKGTNIPQLRSVVMAVSVSSKLALEPVPKYFVDLWEAVRDASQETPFCTYQEYRQLAQNCGVPMDSALNVVTKFCTMWDA